MPARLTGNAIQITGHCGEVRQVYQTVQINGARRFTVGGWCSAYSKKPEDSPVVCQIQVYFAQSNYTYLHDWTYGGAASFHHEEGTWQFACGDVTGAPYQYIKAAGEGNVAALSAVKYLDEMKRNNA